MPQYITLHRNGNGYLVGSVVQAQSQEAAVIKKQSALGFGLRVEAVTDATRGEAGQFFVSVTEEPRPRLVPTNTKIRRV